MKCVSHLVYRGCLMEHGLLTREQAIHTFWDERDADKLGREMDSNSNDCNLQWEWDFTRRW